MAEYYQAHKHELPAGLKTHRPALLRHLMEGMAVEDAFAAVIAEML